jgi:hypothetical protein
MIAAYLWLNVLIIYIYTHCKFEILREFVKIREMSHTCLYTFRMCRHRFPTTITQLQTTHLTPTPLATPPTPAPLFRSGSILLLLLYSYSPPLGSPPTTRDGSPPSRLPTAHPLVIPQLSGSTQEFIIGRPQQLYSVHKILC